MTHAQTAYGSLTTGQLTSYNTQQRPVSAQRNTQFKYRRILNLDECKIVFSILLKTNDLRKYIENEAEFLGQKGTLNSKDVMFQYADLEKLMEGAAELLNKQDLCTREKPQKTAFFEKTDKSSPRSLNIKKMPQLIFQVFST